MATPGITWAFGEVTSLDAAFNISSQSTAKLKDLNDKPVEVVYRGEISVKLSASTSGAPPGTAGKTIVAYPANINATRIPLIGEHIILFQGPGNQLGPAGPAPVTTSETNAGEVNTGNSFDLEWYYLDALALQGSVHLNTNPGANVGAISGAPVTVADGEKTVKADVYESTAAGNPTTNAPKEKGTTKKDQNTVDTLPGNEFKEKTNVNNLQPFEGDAIMQGRYGQSIRFGSATTISTESVGADRYQKQPTWKPGNAGEQAPLIIMRAGPSSSEKNDDNDYIIEQINDDKASIYVCSGQQIALTLASNKFDALNQTHKNEGDASKENENGTTINNTNCNASGAPTVPVEAFGPGNPIPSGVAELEEVPGEWPMYNTRKGTPQAMGKLRIIQGIPFFEHMCDSVLNLIKAAAADGHRIGINSGYRGVKDVVVNGRKYATGQLTLRKQNAKDRSWKTDAMWNNEKSKLWKASSGKFSPATAAPGRSKHQNGIAIDMSTSSRTSKTGMYNWLCWNAYKYGFIRTVSSEEWHFEYRPGSKTFDRCPANQSKWHGQGDGHPHA